MKGPIKEKNHFSARSVQKLLNSLALWVLIFGLTQVKNHSSAYSAQNNLHIVLTGVDTRTWNTCELSLSKVTLKGVD